MVLPPPHTRASDLPDDIRDGHVPFGAVAKSYHIMYSIKFATLYDSKARGLRRKQLET